MRGVYVAQLSNICTIGSLCLGYYYCWQATFKVTSVKPTSAVVGLLTVVGLFIGHPPTKPWQFEAKKKFVKPKPGRNFLPPGRFFAPLEEIFTPLKDFFTPLEEFSTLLEEFFTPLDIGMINAK